MTSPARWDLGFGLVVMAFAALALLVWFPRDINGGFMFVNAIGREEPGDAFFPVILAVGLLLLGALQVAAALRSMRSGARSPARALTLSNLRFLATLIVIVLCGLAIMYWLGPLVVAALNAIGAIEGSYRIYTDTAPYKYLGFVVGGFAMTIALIFMTEGRIRPASIVSIVLVLAVSIIIFDLLLKNVLLPPNAEF